MTKSKTNIIIPCAGKGSRLKIPYSKEIHQISYDVGLIDISLNLCLKNKDNISFITIVTEPHKKDLILYLHKWKHIFDIKICYFNHDFYEWPGSIMSAKNYFVGKNIVLLPDTLITEYKNQNIIKLMLDSLDNKQICFALKKEKNKKKLSNLGALNIKDDKINNFCDKPKENLNEFNCYWAAFAFNKSVGVKLLNFMNKSVRRRKVNILNEKFNTSFFYIKDYLDLGTWENISIFNEKFSNKKIYFSNTIQKLENAKK